MGIKSSTADVKKVLLKRLDETVDMYTNYLNNPYDPIRAHQLRVHTRKLRGLLYFLKPILGEEQYEAMNHPLRGVGKVYGPVRELDVLIASCGEIAMKQPHLSEHYKHLFYYLHHERRKAMEITFQLKNREQVEKTFSTIQRILNEVALVLPNEEKNNWDTFTWKRLKKLHKKMEKSFHQMNWYDFKEVHKTRIRAKKIRYASDEFGSFTKKKTKKLMKTAKKKQGELGHLTDLYVNIDLLSNYSNKVKDEELEKLFNDMREILKDERAQFLEEI